MTRIRDWKLYHQLFLLLFLVNMLDYISTHMLMNIHGYGIEGNPIMLWITQQLDSPVAILLAKITMLPLLWWWVDRRLRTNNVRESIVSHALMFAFGAYTFIVCMNFYFYFHS